ncbi:MAG: hypothetical protein U5L09_08280 [Bacteroidales bacterium]|nr:hypothetical protein [Bacteroidales bacterium]
MGSFRGEDGDFLQSPVLSGVVAVLFLVAGLIVGIRLWRGHREIQKRQ